MVDSCLAKKKEEREVCASRHVVISLFSRMRPVMFKGDLFSDAIFSPKSDAKKESQPAAAGWTHPVLLHLYSH
jgi:hypothetical protein